MQKCWMYKPKQRPTFKEVIEMLVPDIDVSFKDLSYFFSEENKEPPVLEYFDEYEDLDESQLPFLRGDSATASGHASAASGGGCPLDLGVDIDLDPLDLDDDDDHIDLDSGCGIRYVPNRLDASEPCDCIREHNQPVLSGHTLNNSNHRPNTSSTPNSAIASSSNDGSKASSKSSNSSNYNPINGLNIHPNIANGHVLPMRSTTC